MITAIFLALAAIVPQPLVDRAEPIHVQVAEINTYAPHGEPVFTQLLLRRWVWLSHGRGHYVSEYWLLRREPQITWHGGRQVIRYFTDQGDIEIAAERIHRTTTASDPERDERSAWCEEDRRPYLKSDK